jgi:hypothetical protein
MTAIGTRRPREGRCERCDRPLTDETWLLTCRCGCGQAMWCADPHAPGLCCGPIGCVSPIDWRARALAAEAAMKDAEGREALAVSMWNETTLAAQAAARGDGSEPRDVSTDFGIDLFLTVKRELADAEARGRQHALLAALWTLGESRTLELETPWALMPEAAEAFAHQIIDTVGAAIRDDLLALANAPSPA